MKKLPSISPSPAAALASLKKFSQAGSTKIGVLGAFAGAGMDMISATRDEREFLSNLVDEYRPEIAKRLGLAEKQVTAEHFNAAFRDNPVLAQAKEATSMSRVVGAISAGVSVVFGIAAGMGAAFMVRRGQQTEGMQENAASIAGTLAASFGGWSAGKVTRQVLHKRKQGGALEGTAHSQIMVIKNKQQLGEPTDAADIFKVQLAVNPQVGEAIQQTFGKPFGELGATEQQQLMQAEFPDILAMNEEMARRINEGARPQGLLFADVEDVRAKESEKKGVVAARAPEALEQAAQTVPQELPQELPQEVQAPVVEAVQQSQPVTEDVAAQNVQTEQQVAPEQVVPEQVIPEQAVVEPEQERPSYTRGQRDAVQNAIKDVLRSRQESAGVGHVQGIERERAERQENPQEVAR